MKKTSSRESGSALIAVLCLIFTASIMTTMVVALGKINLFTMDTHLKLQRSIYIAEGVASRVQWLLAADKTLYSGDIPGEIDYANYEFDRFLADGVLHTIDYYGEKVQVTITDTISGYDFSGNNYRNSLRTLISDIDSDPDYVEEINKLTTRISDYVDSDDLIGIDGLEANDYEELELYPLPRNGQIEYREELLFIPEFTNYFPVDKNGRLSSIRLIAPVNTVSLSGAPSLFTATAADISARSPDLEESEVNQIMDALNRWKKNREPLNENLEPELRMKIRGFATGESGIYTVLIESPIDQTRPFYRLVFSYEGFKVSGPRNGNLIYLEYNYF